MIWAAPIALTGLALLALPVLIHLMGLGQAKPRPFPSLRFLEGSRLLPSRRTRIHDALLLILRLTVLTAAVVALARPILPAGAPLAGGDGLSVAMIVDTSASLHQAMAGTGRDTGSALMRARATADSLGSEATTTLTIFTSRPADEIAGASTWLQLQPGERELVIISDFQVGSIVANDLAPVSTTVTVRAVRIPLSGGAGNVEATFEQGGADVAARAAVMDGRTQVSWFSAPRSGAREATDAAQPARLAAQSDLPMIDAARRAALVIGRTGGDANAITIVYPGAPGRAELARSGSAPREPWQGDAVQRLSADSLLARAADNATSILADSLPLGAAIVARARTGEPIVAAVAGSNANASSLVLLLNAAPASPVSVALNAAVARIASPSPAELDPAVLSDSAVRALERVAGPVSADANASVPSDTAPSYAPWFWIAALVALAGEAILRRSLASKSTPAVVGDVAR